jgi:D-aminopeptidase
VRAPGYGATTFDLKGGLGSASATTSGGYTIGALACVNAIGSTVVDGGPHFWAAALEQDSSSAASGRPHPATQIPPVALEGAAGARHNDRAGRDRCGPDQGRRPSGSPSVAQGGLARALSVSHAPMDGDIIFAVQRSRGRRGRARSADGTWRPGVRLPGPRIARAIFSGTALPFAGALPAWRDRFGTT